MTNDGTTYATQWTCTFDGKQKKTYYCATGVAEKGEDRRKEKDAAARAAKRRAAIKPRQTVIFCGPCAAMLTRDKHQAMSVYHIEPKNA